MTTIKYAMTIIAALCLALTGGVAIAQKAVDGYRQPMPEIDLMPETEFNVKTKTYEEMGFDDKALSYKVNIPRDWSKVESARSDNYSLSNKILGEMSRFYSPPRLDLRSYLTVEAVELEYQITAEQWLIQYMLSRGYTVQGINSIDNNQVEALYVLLNKKGNSYVVRAVAKSNGKRIVYAQYFIPANYWEEEKQIQAQVVGSFELTSPDNKFVEETIEYYFLDIASFKYPKSWELYTYPLKSIDRMKTELLNVSVKSDGGWYGKKFKSLDGKISIKLVSYYITESLESEISNFKDQLAKEGLLIENLIEAKEHFNYNKNVEFAKTDVYQTADNGDNLINYELWITIMAAGEYYFFITLLTPSRNDDYFVWARNIQTYEFVVANLDPKSNSVIHE